MSFALFLARRLARAAEERNRSRERRPGLSAVFPRAPYSNVKEHRLYGLLRRRREG